MAKWLCTKKIQQTFEDSWQKESYCLFKMEKKSLNIFKQERT